MEHEHTIRFNGVYCAPASNPIRKILRFYADGAVIEATTDAGMTDIASWFKKENFTEDHHSIGSYQIAGDAISFFTTARGYGTILYEGMIVSPNEIHLASKSLINESESSYTVSFFELGLDT